MVLDGSTSRHPHGVRTLLANPAVEIGLVEIDAAAIAEHGLGFDVCDAVVLSEPEAGIDPSELRSIETVLRDALDADIDTEPDAATIAIQQAMATLELSGVGPNG
jgi:hypothetical protein